MSSPIRCTKSGLSAQDLKAWLYDDAQLVAHSNTLLVPAIRLTKHGLFLVTFHVRCGAYTYYVPAEVDAAAQALTAFNGLCLVTQDDMRRVDAGELGASDLVSAYNLPIEVAQLIVYGHNMRESSAEEV